MSTPASWARIAEVGSSLGLRITVGCYRLCGRSACLVLVHAVVIYFFLTRRRARLASRAYLGRMARMPGGREALRREPDVWASFLHFRAFALSIFDRVVIWLGREAGPRFQVFGRDHYHRLLTPQRGGIVVGAHLGSFDALRALADRDGRVVNVLMYTRHAPRINAILRQLSPKLQMRLIQADPGSMDTVLRIRACIERGELVAMLGDRVEPSDRGRTCRATLLGDAVELPQGPYLLAGLLKCPIFFMVALRGKGGDYRVFAEVLSERETFGRAEREKRIQELAAAYAGRLERYCMSEPYQWFNFYDYWEDAAA